MLGVLGSRTRPTAQARTAHRQVGVDARQELRQVLSPIAVRHQQRQLVPRPPLLRRQRGQRRAQRGDGLCADAPASGRAPCADSGGCSGTSPTFVRAERPVKQQVGGHVQRFPAVPLQA